MFFHFLSEERGIPRATSELQPRCGGVKGELPNPIPRVASSQIPRLSAASALVSAKNQLWLGSRTLLLASQYPSVHQEGVAPATDTLALPLFFGTFRVV
jgi:hypothetical protein